MSSRRIVSLVPSLTDMVCEMGLRGEVVGCTSFCVEPPGLQRTARLVGGTKDPDIAAIQELAPTHILVNEEENKPEHIAACQALAPTFVSFPKAPADVPDLLRTVGEWLGVGDQGDQWARRVETALVDLSEARRVAEAQGSWRPGRYLYLIWREPYMVVAGDTYIDGMLALTGYRNAAPAAAGRYPTMTVAEMVEARPDVIFLSSEPYPFRRRDAARLADEWALGERAAAPPPLARIDGQALSWYGTLAVPALTQLRAWVSGEAQTLVNMF